MHLGCRGETLAGDQRGMQSSPKVSVIISCYNHESYIEEAILSAVRQKTDFPYEIIVGDDCSTDGSCDIVERLCADYDDSLRLIQTEHNMGGRANFLNAFAACRGTYVAYLDGDDYWLDDAKLQVQVDLLDADPKLSMCCHPVYWCNDKGEIIGRTRNRPRDKSGAIGLRDVVAGNFSPSCSLMFRRALFQDFPDWMDAYPGVPGDWVTTMNLARQGGIGYIDSLMAVYRRHDRGAWSNKGDLRRLRALSKVYSNILPDLDPVCAEVARSSQARLRIRMAAAHARAGRRRQARLFLRHAWARGWRFPALWRQTLVYILDVHFPGLSRLARDLAAARFKPRRAGERPVLPAQNAER